MSPDRGVFVQPFPPTGAIYQAPKVFIDFHPVWSPNGRELMYVSAACLWSVSDGSSGHS